MGSKTSTRESKLILGVEATQFFSHVCASPNDIKPSTILVNRLAGPPDFAGLDSRNLMLKIRLHRVVASAMPYVV
jgi:hypothetical protein